jgi:hypothetical protein
LNRNAFTLGYQRSPIIFVGGIASQMPGALLPVISISQSQNFDQGVTGGSASLNDDTSLFEFMPMPGGTLAEFQLGTYPFANQTVAANAIIAEPLKIALLMYAPVRPGNGGYDQRQNVFTALQSAVLQHASLGGVYNVATPAFIYTNCALAALRDVSEGDPAKPQDRWVWEFVQPLLTLQQAAQAQGAYLTKTGQGLQQTPNADGTLSWSGAQQTVGAPATLAGAAVVPAATPLPGAAATGPTSSVSSGGFGS